MSLLPFVFVLVATGLVSAVLLQDVFVMVVKFVAVARGLATVAFDVDGTLLASFRVPDSVPVTDRLAYWSSHLPDNRPWMWRGVLCLLLARLMGKRCVIWTNRSYELRHITYRNLGVLNRLFAVEVFYGGKKSLSTIDGLVVDDEDKYLSCGRRGFNPNTRYAREVNPMFVQLFVAVVAFVLAMVVFNPQPAAAQSSIIVPVADIYKAGQPPVGYVYYDNNHESGYLFIRTHYGVTVGSITDVVRSDWYPTTTAIADSINSHNCHDYSTSWIGYADNGHLVGGDRAISPDASIIDVHCLEDYSIIVDVPMSYDTWQRALTLAHTHALVHQESGFGLAISALFLSLVTALKKSCYRLFIHLYRFVMRHGFTLNDDENATAKQWLFVYAECNLAVLYITLFGLLDVSIDYCHYHLNEWNWDGLGSLFAPSALAQHLIGQAKCAVARIDFNAHLFILRLNNLLHPVEAKHDSLDGGRYEDPRFDYYEGDDEPYCPDSSLHRATCVGCACDCPNRSEDVPF